jgi:uncharacterized membrane protein YgcG
MFSLFGIFLFSNTNTVSADTEFVQDNANILSASTQQKINNITVNDFSKLKGKPQYAVVTIKKLPNGEDIDTYKNELFNKLGVGHKGWDNGLLFVISIKDREYGLETGYGMESIVPDGDADDIIDGEVQSLLKSGKYDSAVLKISNNIANIVNHSKDLLLSNKERQQEENNRENVEKQVFIYVFILLFALSITALVVSEVIYPRVKAFRKTKRDAATKKARSIVKKYQSLLPFTSFIDVSYQHEFQDDLIESQPFYICKNDNYNLVDWLKKQWFDYIEDHIAQMADDNDVKLKYGRWAYTFGKPSSEDINNISDLVKNCASERHILIDEIHKYPDWYQLINDYIDKKQMSTRDALDFWATSRFLFKKKVNELPKDQLNKTLSIIYSQIKSINNESSEETYTRDDVKDNIDDDFLQRGLLDYVILSEITNDDNDSWGGGSSGGLGGGDDDDDLGGGFDGGASGGGGFSGGW